MDESQEWTYNDPSVNGGVSGTLVRLRCERRTSKQKKHISAETIIPGRVPPSPLTKWPVGWTTVPVCGSFSDGGHSSSRTWALLDILRREEAPLPDKTTLKKRYTH